MRKKIVIWEAGDTMGGGQRLAIEVAEALRARYDVCFFIPSSGELTEAIEDSFFPFYYYHYTPLSRGKKNIFDIFKFFVFSPIDFVISLALFIRIKPDLIYSNAAPTFIFSSVIGMLFRKPTIWHIHNKFQDKKAVILLQAFGKIRGVKKVIHDSRALEEQFPVLGKKRMTITPCIRLEEYRHVQDNSNIREELGIDRNAHIITQLAWVMEAKGQHILIEAAKRVYQDNKNVCFLIIGKTLSGEEEYKDMLKRKISKYGLDGVVQLVGFPENVRLMLKEAFVNVITSFEGFSIAMLEAAAFNVPTIGPDVGGPSVTIEEGRSGLLYRFRNSVDLAEKILYLLKNEDLYKKMRENNTEFVRGYTMERYYDDIRFHFNEVLEQGF